MKQITLKVTFNIYDDSIDQKEVPNIIVDAVDKYGYAINSCEIEKVEEVKDLIILTKEN